MKITCESCGAKYTIADDKVRGRKVKIRCKGCGTAIVVDGQQEGAPANGAGTTEDDSRAEADANAALEAASIGPSAPPSSDAKWSVNLSETDQRTLSTQEIVQGWASGIVNSDAFVWKEGMADWVPILESDELAKLLNSAPANKPASSPKASAAKSVAPASRPTASAARVTGGRAQPGADLFAAAAEAGADVDVAMPPARAAARPFASPVAASDDAKPTGARNENSVLFSLDALKAGFAGPAPKTEPPKKGNARNTAAADDPFGLGGGGGLTGGAPMFSLADNSALLTAPPPPEPPKPKVVEAFAGSGGVEAKASRKVVVLVSVIAILLIGGGAAAFALNAKSEKEAALAAAASASAAVRAAHEEEEKAKENAAEEARKAEAAKAGAAQAAQAQTAKTEEKSATPDTSKSASAAPPPTPGGTKAVAKKEEKKEDKTPAPAPAGDLQPFSKPAAIAQLGAAAGSASSCKKLGGPTGTGRVTVTFAPSGRVTTATVDGSPFAGTSVGGCVASLFRKAHVPPFSGTSVTVSKSFAIN